MHNERRQILMHNSKTVIYLDHSNLEGEDYVLFIEESAREATNNPSVSNRLILINATGSIMNKEALNAQKKMTAEAGGDIAKVAVFGLTGIQMFFLRTIATFSKVNIKPFPNRESALEWLTR